VTLRNENLQCESFGADADLDLSRNIVWLRPDMRLQSGALPRRQYPVIFHNIRSTRTVVCCLTMFIVPLIVIGTLRVNLVGWLRLIIYGLSHDSRMRPSR
jgi:hypothetical protein